MTIIHYYEHDIELSSKHLGIAYPWGKEYEKQHHLVTVKVGTRKTEFDFYCNEKKLKEYDLVLAFYYFLSDGISFYNAGSIDEFQSEFGYDKVSELLKVYEGCKEAWYKWKPFRINAISLANWLQSRYNL